MFDKMKQLYELKKQADQIKKELDMEVIDVEHGGVTVRINGNMKIIKLNYDDASADKIRDAVNKAIEESQKTSNKKMQGMIGGMDGLSDLLKG